MLSIGREVPACLHTAAELHGFGVLADAITHVAVRPDEACTRRADLWPHQLALAEDDLARLRCGTLATNADRTAVDLARTLPRIDVLPVLDTRGRARRFVDLAWEEVKVGLEYDGEEGHTGQRALRSDRRRHNFLQDEGWAMFYATDLASIGTSQT